MNQLEWLKKLIKSKDRVSASVALGRGFLRASPEERLFISSGWNFNAEWPYPDPARLACTIGEASSPQERIACSFVLDSLEKVFGTREHLIALSASYRSCELAKLSGSDVFRDVASALPEREADVLVRFLKRTREDRSLEAFGLFERVNADGETEIHFEP